MGQPPPDGASIGYPRFTNLKGPGGSAMTGIRRKLHVYDRGVGNVSCQESVTECSAYHILERDQCPPSVSCFLGNSWVVRLHCVTRLDGSASTSRYIPRRVRSREGGAWPAPVRPPRQIALETDK